MLAADPVITDLSTWDAMTWIAAVAALITLGALGIAVLARLDSRRSSRAGADSAEAAKQSAAASERSAMTGEVSARAAQRSADAAEEANALQKQAAAQELFDRHDAAGPQFEVVEEALVGDDGKAQVKLRIVGGPGELELEVSTRSPWCAGVSEVRDGIPGIVLIPPHEPGDTVAFFAHIDGWVWADDDPVMLPLTVMAEGADHRNWRRRVSVPVLPGPPTEMMRRDD